MHRGERRDWGAETEELVDRPAIVNCTVRVAGPFTMEGVTAREEGRDCPVGGERRVAVNIGPRGGQRHRHAGGQRDPRGNEGLWVLTEGRALA